MTSIEWLIDQLQKGRATFFKINENEERIITLVGEDVVNQAKEMHKQEIIDAVGVGSQFDRGYLYGYHDKAEQYYQETFVSKGSDTLKDYHPVDTNKMIDHIGEVNEMVEDDVEKLAEEEFSDNQLKDMYSYECTLMKMRLGLEENYLMQEKVLLRVTTKPKKLYIQRNKLVEQ